jgi:hypothetical protein
MTTQTIADGKVRQRGFALRFSLRMLMLMMTVLAIGSGVWWRWPIQRTQQTKMNHRIPGVGSPIYGTETVTYHRGWNGVLIQHGRRTLIYDGKLYEDEILQEGIKHGPARYPHGLGYIPETHLPADLRSATGEFFHGKKHGTWEFIPPEWQTAAPGKRYRSIETWNRGQRHGVFEWFDEAGKSCYRHEFRNDLLVDPENNPTRNLLLKRIAAGQFQDLAPMQKIIQGTMAAYSNTKLNEATDDLKECHGLTMAFRYKKRIVEHQGHSVVIYHVPVSIQEINAPLYTAFDKILRPLDLVVDYRFGVLVVVDAEGAADWRDATGVLDLHPSPGSPLESRLDAPAKATMWMQLAGVLQNLSRDQQIPVEFRLEQIAASAAPSNPLTKWPGLPMEALCFDDATRPPKEPLPITLRQLLGLILDQANLHCHEEKGVLIIESPPRGPPVSASTTSPRRP